MLRQLDERSLSRNHILNRRDSTSPPVRSLRTDRCLTFLSGTILTFSTLPSPPKRSLSI